LGLNLLANYELPGKSPATSSLLSRNLTALQSTGRLGTGTGTVDPCLGRSNTTTLQNRQPYQGSLLSKTQSLASDLPLTSRTGSRVSSLTSDNPYSVNNQSLTSRTGSRVSSLTSDNPYSVNNQRSSTLSAYRFRGGNNNNNTSDDDPYGNYNGGAGRKHNPHNPNKSKSQSNRNSTVASDKKDKDKDAGWRSYY